MGAPSQSSQFWEPSTFDDLALEQVVHPVEDLRQVFGGWPEDADFDSFLEAIMITLLANCGARSEHNGERMDCCNGVET